MLKFLQKVAFTKRVDQSGSDKMSTWYAAEWHTGRQLQKTQLCVHSSTHVQRTRWDLGQSDAEAGYQQTLVGCQGSWWMMTVMLMTSSDVVSHHPCYLRSPSHPHHLDWLPATTCQHPDSTILTVYLEDTGQHTEVILKCYNCHVLQPTTSLYQLWLSETAYYLAQNMVLFHLAYLARTGSSLTISAMRIVPYKRSHLVTNYLHKL